MIKTTANHTSLKDGKISLSTYPTRVEQGIHTLTLELPKSSNRRIADERTVAFFARTEDALSALGGDVRITETSPKSDYIYVNFANGLSLDATQKLLKLCQHTDGSLLEQHQQKCDALIQKNEDKQQALRDKQESMIQKQDQNSAKQIMLEARAKRLAARTEKRQTLTQKKEERQELFPKKNAPPKPMRIKLLRSEGALSEIENATIVLHTSNVRPQDGAQALIIASPKPEALCRTRVPSGALDGVHQMVQSYLQDAIPEATINYSCTGRDDAIIINTRNGLSEPHVNELLAAIGCAVPVCVQEHFQKLSAQLAQNAGNLAQAGIRR